jgi:HEAT repeat protein
MLRDGKLDVSELADTIIDLAHSDLLNRDDVRRDLVKLVSHPDCEVRSEAMGALAYHGVSFRWEVDPGRRFLADLLQAVDRDFDSDCRRAAAGALGSLFKGTCHRGIMEALAGVCRKTDEESDVRAFAYVAFLDVVGIPKGDQPSPINLEIGQHEFAQMAAYLGKPQ